MGLGCTMVTTMGPLGRGTHRYTGLLYNTCNLTIITLFCLDLLGALLFLEIIQSCFMNIKLDVFNKTIIIPPALVGYEMIIANSTLCAVLAIYHLISNVHSWNNCKINCSCNSPVATAM